MLAVLTAFLMLLAFAPAASAHQDGEFLHDDEQGRPSGSVAENGVYTAVSDHSAAHPGSGVVNSVDNDSPADAVVVIRDYGLENAPIIVGVIGAIFLVGLTFYLIRRGLMKARGAMRL